ALMKSASPGRACGAALDAGGAALAPDCDAPATPARAVAPATAARTAAPATVASAARSGNAMNRFIWRSISLKAGVQEQAKRKLQDSSFWAMQFAMRGVSA